MKLQCYLIYITLENNISTSNLTDCKLNYECVECEHLMIGHFSLVNSYCFHDTYLEMDIGFKAYHKYKYDGFSHYTFGLSHITFIFLGKK